jgi:beta-lactamase superfamily II metal-dependent hydrolase
MEKLQVRMYNVLFGDAFLVSMPDRDEKDQPLMRHILIDVGNVLGGDGGVDAVFRPVLTNILEVLASRPLDLYVMTHEHMDHVQGPLYMNAKVPEGQDLKKKLSIQHAWLTASSAETYYDTHPAAKKKKAEALAMYETVFQYVSALPGKIPLVEILMANNNPRKTEDCVAFIRTLAAHPWYIHRETNLEGKHPFRDAKFEIWAPEEDTSTYYESFYPLQLGAAAVGGGTPGPAVEPSPPPGVDAGDFYNLVAMRRNGCMDNLLSIDKAANNTSIVFCLEWRGWRLLFPGDAEARSWKEADKANRLAPVHFIKVSHHGSRTGNPPPECLEKILPAARPDSRRRVAAVSTIHETYPGVPDDNTLTEIGKRCELKDTEGTPAGSFIDVSFA